uniref:Ig-like domain-containing protein n=1 Tax=Leptobrachium leishanense TaxID=445787 RepID=A0A8C5ML48_9ANUR
MVTVPEYGVPEYISLRYMDGIEITRYDSDTRRVVPVAQWMKKVDPKILEEQTETSRGLESTVKFYIKLEMIRLNHTEGYRCVQWMFGCELRDDGSTTGYAQLGYEGKDFLVLDPVQLKFIWLTDEAQSAAQTLNGPSLQVGERMQDYLETECINWLRKCIGYGKEALNKRVRPKVKVSDQTVNGVAKLHCQVYGFYPRDVDVKWQKNGIDVPSYEAKHILPNSDGTYQIRVTVEVLVEDREGHSCHVDHASLRHTLIVNLEPKSGSNTVGIVIGVLVVVIAVAAVGFIVWRKRSGKRQTLGFFYALNIACYMALQI